MTTRSDLELKRSICCLPGIFFFLAVLLSFTVFSETPQQSAADSIFSSLITDEYKNYRMEKDTARWMELSSDFINSYPVPVPKEHPCGDSTWNIHIGPRGIPMVKRIYHPVYGELLVTLHNCNDNLALSFWQNNGKEWIQTGSTKTFNTDAADFQCAAFIGDSSKMCLGVAEKYKSFSLYKLDPVNPSVLYSEVIPYNDAQEKEYKVSFVYGYTAAALGYFAARSGKDGHGGWERMKIYYWDGNSCRAIPIPGAEDAALSSNHISNAQWLDSRNYKTADFFISERYIDDYSVFPCVYRFDGRLWKDVSAECGTNVNNLSFDSRYKNKFSILHDSSLANSYDSIMADTLAVIEKAARFNRRPSKLRGEEFEIAVHYYAKGDYDRAIRMLRFLHLPYGPGDDTTEKSLKQLAALKALFISVGDLSFCGFADTLLDYGHKMKRSDMGSKIEPVIMPASPPHHLSDVVNRYIEELWPEACKELEQMHNEQSGGMNAIADKMKPYDTLQMLISNVNIRQDASSVNSMLGYFSKHFTFNNAQFMLMAFRGKNLIKLANTYCDSAVSSKVKTKSFDQNIPSTIFLNFCNPVHSRIFEQAGIVWDTTDYPVTQTKLSYGLALGDSSALKIMKDMLGRNDSIFDNLIWDAVNPQWGIKPISPACAFSFETAWKMRPSIETLQRYIPGLIDFAVYSSDIMGISVISRAKDIIDKSEDKDFIVAMAALSIISLTEAVKWSGFPADSLMKRFGVSEDTLNALLLEDYSQMMNTEEFDFRDIVRCLEGGGKKLIDWAVANGAFGQYRELLISLMLVSDIKGYDTLMKPFYRNDQQENYSFNKLDFCYILRLGSKKTQSQLVSLLENDSSYTSEKLLLDLTLAKSNHTRQSILKKLSLYDVDSVGEDSFLMPEWTNNDYLMLIHDRHLWKEKWQRLYFFRKFASNIAIKDWWYAILTNEFRNRISTSELLSRHAKGHFPLEFACDVMSFKELEKYLYEMRSNPQSKIDLYWNYPAIEQVYAYRLLWEKHKVMILRFAK